MTSVKTLIYTTPSTGIEDPLSALDVSIWITPITTLETGIRRADFSPKRDLAFITPNF